MHPTEKSQKITAHIPISLLEDAQKITGKGITETVKDGLRHLARANAYKNLRKMKGKVKFSIKLDELRKDRDEL